MQYLEYKKNPTMKMEILASMLSPNLNGMACTLCKNIDINTLLLHIQSNFIDDISMGRLTNTNDNEHAHIAWLLKALCMGSQ